MRGRRSFWKVEGPEAVAGRLREEDMLSETISVIALVLLATLAGSAQESGYASESPQTPERAMAQHGHPDCDYPGSFCVWGRLRDATGPNRARPKPMRKGPIDVCAQWDFNCSSPYQTVCKLHGPHGFEPAEGSYFFVLSVQQGWRVRPRVTGSHLSWEPPDKTYAAGSVPSGDLEELDFVLLGTATDTGICNE